LTALTVHLMRHGAPQLAGRLLGHMDAPSLPEGLALCVERARALDFTQLVTSDLSRARSPGAVIAAERGVPQREDARWRELNFGAWEGADPATLDQQALSRFWDDPDAFPPPDGERWSDLCDRVRGALDALEPDALVICHAGAMRAALSITCNFNVRQGWAVDLPYGAVLSLRLWPGDAPSGQITGLLA